MSLLGQINDEIMMIMTLCRKLKTASNMSMYWQSDDVEIAILNARLVYLSRCFHWCPVLQQQFDNFYPIFLAGDVQRSESILKQHSSEISRTKRASLTDKYENSLKTHDVVYKRHQVSEFPNLQIISRQAFSEGTNPGTPLL